MHICENVRGEKKERVSKCCNRELMYIKIKEYVFVPEKNIKNN